jgi:hypothetical protein
MAFSVNGTARRDLKTILEEALQKIRNAGGTVEGDVSSGTFKVVGIEGRYESEGNTVTVTVDKNLS